MTDYVNPVPVTGPAENVSNDHRQCAHLEVDSVIQRWFPGAVVPVIDNASLPDIGDALAAANLPGVAWHTEYGSGAAGLTWALSCIDGSGDAYPVILFQCDPATNPVPVGSTDIAHYITGYGTANSRASVLDYNCWLANLQGLSFGALEDAYRGAAIISRAAPPAPIGDTDMKGAAFYDGPDGKHRVTVDAKGRLYDQRQLTPGTDNWSPKLNVLGITGLQAWGLLGEPWVDAAAVDANGHPAPRININLAGGLGDTPWVVCQNGTWSRLPNG